METDVTRARVLTFHVERGDLSDLTEALDAAADRFGANPDFRGLVCLSHDGLRNEIMVVTLWEGRGLEDTEAEDRYARQLISATTDLGVTGKAYDVLRLVAGPATLESVSVQG